MRHTDEVELTFRGMSLKPERYKIPPEMAQKVKRMLEYTFSQKKEKSIPAEEVFPDLYDPIKGPATVLRGARYREEMTQKQLAEALGIRQHHLSEMENGKRPIGKAMAKKLAEALNAHWKNFL